MSTMQPLSSELASATDQMGKDTAATALAVAANSFPESAESANAKIFRISLNNEPANDDTRHVCTICDHTFTRKHNLKAHLLTHTNEKPFTCMICSSQFRRLYDLKRHEKVHTREKPYSCALCKKTFARADALIRHKNSSSGCQGLSKKNMKNESNASPVDEAAKNKRRKVNKKDPFVHTLETSVLSHDGLLDNSNDSSNFFVQQAIDSMIERKEKNNANAIEENDKDEPSVDGTGKHSGTPDARERDDVGVHGNINAAIEPDVDAEDHEHVNLIVDDVNAFAHNKEVHHHMIDLPANLDEDSNLKNEGSNGDLTASNIMSVVSSVSQPDPNMMMNVPTLNLSLISGLLSDILCNSSTNSQGISSIQLSEYQFSVLKTLLETLQQLDTRVTKLENQFSRFSEK